MYDTPLCVVCSHFASGEGEMDAEKRNGDFHEAVRKLAFSAARPAGPSSSSASPPRVLGALEHPVVLWLGDLNYRLTAPDDVVRTAIATADW